MVEHACNDENAGDENAGGENIDDKNVDDELDRRPVKVKHRILSQIYPYQGRAEKLLNLLHVWLKAGKWPGAGKMHPLLKPKNNYFVNMPVNMELATEQQEMSVGVLHRLIEESKYIYIMDSCVCRTGRDCKEHRHDIGCMFFGASGLDIVPPISHPATKEEAYRHIEEALADGLVPATMRLRADNYAFLFPDHHTILAVCFCCDCCCFMSYYKEVPNKNLGPVFHTVPGAHLDFNQDICATCTTHDCEKHCYMKNISFDEQGRMVRADRCKLCGRCVTACPNGAVHLYTTDAQAYEKVFSDLEGLLDLQGPGTGKKKLPF